MHKLAVDGLIFNDGKQKAGAKLKTPTGVKNKPVVSIKTRECNDGICGKRFKITFNCQKKSSHINNTHWV